jgi:hypothetical protein
LLCHFALLFLLFKFGVAPTLSGMFDEIGIWSLVFVAWDCGLAGGFILGAEASGADVDFSFPSLYHNRSSLDIRQPLSRGMLFGMAYTVPKGSFFTANFALHRNFSFC